MTRLFCILLMAIFSLSSPAMEGNADFWQSSLAAEGISDFDYVIGGNSSLRNSAGYYLPRGAAGENSAGASKAGSIFSTQTKLHSTPLARLSNSRQGRPLSLDHAEPMKKIQIDVLSEAVNCSIVQMPGRKFPGVVLQGDSLRILLDSAEEIHQLCSPLRNSELSSAAVALKDKLAGYVAAYENTMQKTGRDLPYPQRS